VGQVDVGHGWASFGFVAPTRWCITIRPCMSENSFAATGLASTFGGQYP
jgi:hypothetical protein